METGLDIAQRLSKNIIKVLHERGALAAEHGCVDEAKIMDTMIKDFKIIEEGLRCLSPQLAASVQAGSSTASDDTPTWVSPPEGS